VPGPASILSRRLQGFQITGCQVFTFPLPQMHMNQTIQTGAMCIDSLKQAPDPCEPKMTHMTALGDLSMGWMRRSFIEVAPAEHIIARSASSVSLDLYS
jgi:hypothetical protein